MLGRWVAVVPFKTFPHLITRLLFQSCSGILLELEPRESDVVLCRSSGRRRQIAANHCPPDPLVQRQTFAAGIQPVAQVPPSISVFQATLRSTFLFRISNIRSFVVSEDPNSASRPFVLMTTFPNKELSDESLTLKEANLLNAVVVQRMI